MSDTRVRRMHIWMGIFALTIVILRMVQSLDKEIPAIYYFTVQSNLLVALYWIWDGLGYGDRYPKAKVWLAGAVTTYITITAVIYMALLHQIFIDLNHTNLDNGKIDQWQYSVEIIMTYLLHVIIPILMVVDYIFFTPDHSSVKPYQWLVYPMLYGIGHTIYGVSSDRFLYPFLNPTKAGGWGMVCVNVVLMFLFVIGLTYGLRALNRWKNRRIGGYQRERVA